jgi:5-methylcytosine-specific restriction protein A
VTGFAPLVRGIIRDRSSGMCEVQVACEGIAAVQQHHRRTRGMGSTKRPESNLPANGLHVCIPCHVHIGANPAQAYEKGWLVRQSADPALVPVLYRGEWFRLDNVGSFTPMEGSTHG